VTVILDPHYFQDRSAGAERLGLFTHHITALPDVDREWMGKVTVWRDGSIAQVAFDTDVKRAGVFSPLEERLNREDIVPLAIADKDSGDNTVDWKRGTVKGFSKDSRRRLMQEAAKLDKRYRPVFVTLTYPDVFDQEPGKWKDHMAEFRRRLERQWPDCAAIWRMEMKVRKSGDNAGVVAPHFHVILYLGLGGRRENWHMSNEYLAKVREWVSLTWYSIVGSEDERHLHAGTQVKVLFNDAGVTRYISKYIAKVDSDAALEQYPDGFGRCWGKWHEDRLPQSETITLHLTHAETLAVMRYFKFQMGKEDEWGYQSLHCFVDPDEFLENLDSIIAAFMPGKDEVYA